MDIADPLDKQVSGCELSGALERGLNTPVARETLSGLPFEGFGLVGRGRLKKDNAGGETGAPRVSSHRVPTRGMAVRAAWLPTTILPPCAYRPVDSRRKRRLSRASRSSLILPTGRGTGVLWATLSRDRHHNSGPLRTSARVRREGGGRRLPPAPSFPESTPTISIHMASSLHPQTSSRFHTSSHQSTTPTRKYKAWYHLMTGALQQDGHVVNVPSHFSTCTIVSYWYGRCSLIW